MNEMKKHDEPMDSLTAVGQQMLAEFEKCAGDIADARALVLVTLHGRGGIAMAGYDDKDPSTAAADLFVHLRAILRAYGKDAVLIGPDDVETRIEGQPAAMPSSPAPSRQLKKEERRIITDALRLAANETRKAKSAALAENRFLFGVARTNHIDSLSRLAGDQDRLAAELGELDVRLERSVS